MNALKIILFIFLFDVLECYKILVYNPKWGGSHVTFMGKTADILANAGHDVVRFELTRRHFLV